MFSWLKKAASDIYGLMSDPIVAEEEIETSAGYLTCQKRSKASNNSEYIVLRAQGGDATIWITLDRIGVDQLRSFLEDVQIPAEI
ncbi:hypothetical protein FHW16_005785 [Phyllobacterium myrsinacearum]|uniref:Uncharacterized protein n=1 Tax=Phyllobacterium myrsinacearum TaxID=28101 RepID=A0A839F0A4_9HYPH|nr:hypothetical protein [Phyllobacterium myrsinacearum]